MSSAIAATAGSPPARAAMNPRTRLLLEGRIVPTLLLLAWPNILVMLAQASTGLVETWFVSRLGTPALAGMALVFPGFMMMQMLSGGAVGGGISSAIARALGAGRRDDADALVLHAIIINVALGVLFTVLALVFGRPLYAAMGGKGASLEAALDYSNVVFAGVTLVWLMNALASVLRGTGNMLVPSVAICAGFVLLVPLSPVLIFGLGPIPAMGIAGGGIAVVVTIALVHGGDGLVPPVGTQRGAPAVAATAQGAVRRHPARGRGRFGQHAADHARLRAHHGTRGRRRRPGGRGRLRHRRPPRVSAHPAGVRTRRAAGGAGRHQHRRRASRSARCASRSPAARSRSS